MEPGYSSTSKFPRRARQRIERRPLGRAIAEGLADVWRYRYVLWMLAERDVRVRYKQTSLGIAWALLQPIATAALLSFVFGRQFGADSRGPAPVSYALFALAGLVPWMFVSNSVTAGGTSLLANPSLITKVRLPRVLIPLSTVVCGLVDLAIGAVLLVGYAVWGWYQGTVSLRISAAALALSLLLSLLTASSVAIFLSALTVQYRDVRHALPFISQIWLLATPVIYPSSAVAPNQPLWQFVFRLNPMTSPVEGFRWGLWGPAEAPFPLTALSVLIGLGLFLCSFAYFQHVERSMADVI